MTAVTNPYDALYTNLKNRCDVTYDGFECTIGECMLMRAGKRQSSVSELPIEATYNKNTLTTIVDYISDSLTVRQAPEKNKTLHSFPYRTSISAILSAVASCALIFSLGIFALMGNTFSPITAESGASENVQVESEELPEVEYTEEG